MGPRVRESETACVARGLVPVYAQRLPRLADLVLPRHGKVIFVHGCWECETRNLSGLQTGLLDFLADDPARASRSAEARKEND